MTPSYFYFFRGGFSANIFRFGSHSCYFVSASSVFLDFSWFIWLGQVGARFKFSVLVELVFLRRGSAQICRACFRFFSFVLILCDPMAFLFFLHRGSARICRACFILCFLLRWSCVIPCPFFSFLVLFGFIRFVGTWLLLRGPGRRKFFLRI